MTPQHVTAEGLKYADHSLSVFTADCPACGHPLEWIVRYPPAPGVYFDWCDPDGEGRTIIDCPACGEPLPEGDLR